ncbi:hypothetical protein MKEN_00841400 [Mycena kentingensis (nom. inval.)]|nr:hypothetical protein MKEN_00841400 [Mycena kentingensis (nom. inval.)]
MYMPGAAAVMATQEAQRDANAPPPLPEDIALVLPSAMPTRGEGSLPGVAAVEERLRVSQCENSLSKLRYTLHGKRWLIAHRNANATGQNQTTKSAKLIQRVGTRADRFSWRYRRGHQALGGLAVVHRYPELRVLAPEDVQLPEDIDIDIDASRKLALAGATRGTRPARNMPSTSRRVMSWIWTAVGAFHADEQSLHETMRVEWTRALARKNRWSEEVLLLEEEMRRVLRHRAAISKNTEAQAAMKLQNRLNSRKYRQKHSDRIAEARKQRKDQQKAQASTMLTPPSPALPDDSLPSPEPVYHDKPSVLPSLSRRATSPSSRSQTPASPCPDVVPDSVPATPQLPVTHIDTALPLLPVTPVSTAPLVRTAAVSTKRTPRMLQKGTSNTIHRHPAPANAYTRRTTFLVPAPPREAKSPSKPERAGLHSGENLLRKLDRQRARLTVQAPRNSRAVTGRSQPPLPSLATMLRPRIAATSIAARTVAATSTSAAREREQHSRFSGDVRPGSTKRASSPAMSTDSSSDIRCQFDTSDLDTSEEDTSVVGVNGMVGDDLQ